MKIKTKLMLMLSALLVGGMATVSAQTEEKPIITFKSSIYDNVGSANAFSFRIGATEQTYIDVDYGAGPVEVEIDQATFDSESSSIKATNVSGSIGPTGIVKVYGDASLIDYLDLEGVYITELDISALTELQVLNLSHNLIGELDLSGMTKLQSLDISDNPFDVKPVIIGPNKPDLAILSIAVIDHIDQSFNPSDYPNLLSLEAFSCYELTNCDVTGCPNLLRLSIDVTNVSELDVTKNEKLLILNISDTKVQSIDLSNNKFLTEFYCSHSGSVNNEYRLSSIDISKNTELQRLFVGYNYMSKLDVSNNPKLTDISAAYNNFTELNLDNNQSLYNVDIAKNLMTFATLPLPRFNFHEYYYQQRNIAMERSYAEGTVLDFSDKVLREGGETNMMMAYSEIDADGNTITTELAADEYYTFTDGKITLLKATPDSVNITFHNTLFPDYDLYTGNFIVKNENDFGKDSRVLQFRVKANVATLNMSIGMAGATAENPKHFTVDFGDGKLVELTTTTDVLPETANVTGGVKGSGTISVYIPEGEDFTALSLKGIQLRSINLDDAHSLRFLNLDGCELMQLSTTYNRCLYDINLDNNRLTTLDLSSPNASNFKINLRYVSAANNSIGFFQVHDNRYLRTLNLSSNELTEINLTNIDNLVSLDVSDNQISKIDLTHAMGLIDLNAANNELSELTFYEYNVVENLNISGNLFAIPNLPRPGEFKSYIYAPQHEFQLPKMAPTANLSSQWLDVDGQTTQYKWYMAETNELVSDEDIVAGVEGRFKFVKSDLGLVYCQFTHPLYPDFEGENIYRTTNVQTAPIPDKEMFSLTTLADGIGRIVMTAKEPNTVIYIDWHGTGDDLVEYIVDSEKYTVYNMDVYANAKASAYCYTEDDDLTVLSIAAGPLGSLDVSGMTNLISFGSVGSKLPADKIKLPESSAIYEIRIDGAAIEDIDLTQYPKLRMIGLNDNNLKSFDATPFKELQVLYLNNNVLEDIKLDNPKMWELVASNNNLENIDLSKLPQMRQLYLSENKFSQLDLSKLSALKYIDISKNYFTFTTLPANSPNYTEYTYANQAPVNVEPVDGVVDLSSQKMVNDIETQYRWFIGTPYFDDENQLYGEELIEDEEYTIDGGVTTFLEKFQNVICVMTNANFPALYLYTNFMDIDQVGVENVSIDNDSVAVVAGEGAIHIAAPAGTACSAYNADGRMMGKAVVTSTGHTSIS
ncbi:MAG: leucine-rich repeat domain-containing protein, partial [Muribaculaceae bacterium]|nr:leucine-rich repeat domain-containing protein [Muribaculaceae bacterium]